MSPFWTTIPVLLAVAGALAAATVRRLRVETALLEAEVVACGAIADAAVRVRRDAEVVATRTAILQRAAARPGAPAGRVDR